MSVVLTEKAAIEVKRIIEDQKLDEGTVLRIGVSGGGCSGFSYALGFDKDYDEKVDSKYEYHGIPLVVDKKSALYLDGTNLIASSLYNYEDEVVDSFTSQPRGFNLRGSRQINGGTSITLNGPTINQLLTTTPSDTSGTVFASGSNFLIFRLSSAAIVDLIYATGASSPGLTIIAIP